jgi:hypothetical protein
MGLTNYAVIVANEQEAKEIVAKFRKLFPKTDRNDECPYYGKDIKWKWAPVEPFLGISLCDGPYKYSEEEIEEDDGEEQGQRGIGHASFRGKVYDTTIESVTDNTVYRYLLLPHEVAEMADDFKKHLIENNMTDPTQLKGEDFEEFNLWAFFEVCKENNYGILGSW